MNRKGFKDWGVVVGVIIVVLLGIIIYASMSPEENTEDVEEFSYPLLDAAPGELRIAETTNYYLWNESHTGVELNGMPQVSSTALAEELVVKQGVFSGDKFSTSFFPVNNTVGAKLFFNVLDSNGGEIIIQVNGREVFAQAQQTGSDFKVDIPFENILLGEENKLEISTSRPFWLAFWKTNSYSLEGVYLDQSTFNEETARKSVVIALENSQVMGVASAKLNAIVNKLEGAESKKIKINLNGESIYDNIPGAMDGQIDVTVPLRTFIPGENNFEFATELYGAYNVDFELNLRILNLTEKSYALYELRQAADNIWPYIELGQQDKDYVCELSIERSGGAKSITVWINDNRNVLAFPSDNLLTENICKYLEKDRNTIMLIAEESSNSDSTFIELNKVSLIVKSK